jgi:hypothetical protein
MTDALDLVLFVAGLIAAVVGEARVHRHRTQRARGDSDRR